MEPQLTGVTPALRLQSGKGEPPVFVQHGKAWSEGGDAVADLPEWFWTEAAKVSAEAAAECGLANIKRPVATQSPFIPTTLAPGKIGQPAIPWTCGDCSQTIPLRQKGLHIARHAKKQPKVN